jgi:hypothetical protein
LLDVAGQNQLSSLLASRRWWRCSRQATWVGAPMEGRSAIHSNVIAVSRRSRAAIRTFCGSLFRQPCSSCAVQPRALSSSWCKHPIATASPPPDCLAGSRSPGGKGCSSGTRRGSASPFSHRLPPAFPGRAAGPGRR